jgi:hypothetical protein
VPLLATATRPAPGDFVVDFDRKNGVRFRVAVATIVWAVVFSLIVGHVYVAMASGRISNGAFLIVVLLLFGLLRVLRRWQRKEFDAQKCTISDRRVVFKSGWLNRSTKFVPLDRIQDASAPTRAALAGAGQRCERPRRHHGAPRPTRDRIGGIDRP